MNMIVSEKFIFYPIIRHEMIIHRVGQCPTTASKTALKFTKKTPPSKALSLTIFLKYSLLDVQRMQTTPFPHLKLLTSA